MRVEWRLEVGYKSKLYFDLPIHDPKHMDRVVEKKLHKRTGGSGMGLWRGATRDLSFYYRSKKEAEQGEKIARRIKSVVHTSVEEC